MQTKFVDFAWWYKHEGLRSTPTDGKFFGTWPQFEEGILKEMRSKRV